TIRLLRCELKHEIFREAAAIPSNLFIETLSRNVVQLSKVSIEHDLLLPDQIDAPLDELGGDGRKGLYLFGFAFSPFRALLHRPNWKQKSRLLVQSTGARLAGKPLRRRQGAGEVES